MFFIPCDNWKTVFRKSLSLYHYTEVIFNCRVLAFFETSDLKEVRILFPISRVTVQW